MPYFSILSIVYRFIVSSDVINYFVFTIRINSSGAVSMVMAALELIETLIDFMSGSTSGIVGYTQRATGIYEALPQHPQHRVVDFAHRRDEERYRCQHTAKNEHRHGAVHRDVLFPLPCHGIIPFRSAAG